MARPCKLTPEVQDRIVEAIRGGSYREIAARLVNIHEATLYQWLKDGREAKRGFKHEFHEAIKKAEAEWEEEQVRAIRETAEGGQLLSRTITEKKNGDTVTQETYTHPEWTARAWLLERKAYERWGRKQLLEVSGSDKGPPVRITYVDGNKEA